MTTRALYVNNGINISELETMTAAVAKQDHPFTVFTLGRICNQKGPSLFNEVAQRLPDVHFLWIGNGELRDELMSDNITVTGWVERKTAVEYAMNADVFLLTSRWEGLPISLLEAMYMRKPCVVSDVIGSRDVIHNGENGFVCKSIDEFSRAIVTARDGNVQMLLDAGTKDITDIYNTKVMARRYIDIYESTTRE